MPIPFIAKSVSGLQYGQPNSHAPLWSRFIENFMFIKARRSYQRISPHLLSKNILDVGFGTGTTSSFLTSQGFNVTGVDVVNLSLYRDHQPTIYDGHILPYRSRQFDTSLLIHVLHHCSDPLRVLREAKRCARRTILIEDTYRNPFEKISVSLNDMVGNFEFFQHPYRTYSHWRQTLTKEGFKIIHSHTWSEMLSTAIFPTRYCLFVIE